MDSRGAKCTDRRSKQLSLSQSVTHSKHSARCFSRASWCLTTPRLTWKITTETGLCVVTVTNSVVNKLVTDHATSRVCALKRLVIRHCSRPSVSRSSSCLNSLQQATCNNTHAQSLHFIVFILGPITALQQYSDAENVLDYDWLGDGNGIHTLETCSTCHKTFSSGICV